MDDDKYTWAHHLEIIKDWFVSYDKIELKKENFFKCALCGNPVKEGTGLKGWSGSADFETVFVKTVYAHRIHKKCFTKIEKWRNGGYKGKKEIEVLQMIATGHDQWFTKLWNAKFRKTQEESNGL